MALWAQIISYLVVGGIFYYIGTKHPAVNLFQFLQETNGEFSSFRLMYYLGHFAFWYAIATGKFEINWPVVVIFIIITFSKPLHKWAENPDNINKIFKKVPKVN